MASYISKLRIDSQQTLALALLVLGLALAAADKGSVSTWGSCGGKFSSWKVSYSYSAVLLPHCDPCLLL
jgi:hypothetical protein